MDLTTNDISYFVGVDVGTGSARAALVTNEGRVIKTSVKSIQTWSPKTEYYEQSSDDIWTTCVAVIQVLLFKSIVMKIYGLIF